MTLACKHSTTTRIIFSLIAGSPTRKAQAFSQTTPQQNGHSAIGSRNGYLIFASGTGNEVYLSVPMVFNPDLVTQRLKVWVNTFNATGNLTHWIALSKNSRKL